MHVNIPHDMSAQSVKTLIMNHVIHVYILMSWLLYAVSRSSDEYLNLCNDKIEDMTSMKIDTTRLILSKTNVKHAQNAIYMRLE